jgi:hypothetical protein
LKIVFQPELLSGRASSWLREPDNLRTFVSSKRELTNSKVEAARKLLASGTRPREVAGHPKLKNDLRRSSMEEIGSRATIFELEGLGSEKRKYLKWLLAQSVAPKTKIESVMTDDAVAMLSEKLSTPLQFEYYLTRALEEAYKVGQKPVGADMIENVLAKDINGLEPRLTRQGYNAKVLAELLNAKPREIKSFLSGQLASGRTQELQSELLAAGIPF